MRRSQCLRGCHWLSIEKVAALHCWAALTHFCLITGKPSMIRRAGVGRQFSGRATLEEAPCRELLLRNDLFLKHQQAVWQAVALRGCFVSVEPRRKSRAGRS